jgi:hypothetical protein
MASNLDEKLKEKKSGLLSRRQALLSIASITAGVAILPRTIFGAAPAKNSLRLAVIGDWGTGDDKETGIASQVIKAHKGSPLDFIIAAGDNIYPDGGGGTSRGNSNAPTPACSKMK